MKTFGFTTILSVTFACTSFLACGGDGAKYESIELTKQAVEPAVKIMPLGASITEGLDGTTHQLTDGYRVGLKQLLTDDGVDVDFVGSNPVSPATCPTSDLTDCQNEGHSGWKIKDPTRGIFEHVLDWMTASDPKAILLHVGTNDLNISGGCDATCATNAAARMSDLIDRIRGKSSTVELFVSSLGPISGVTASTLDAFNGAVQTKVDTTTHAHYVNMSLNVDDLGTDGIHPTPAGYFKMAMAWYTAFQANPDFLNRMKALQDKDNDTYGAWHLAPKETTNGPGLTANDCCDYDALAHPDGGWILGYTQCGLKKITSARVDLDRDNNCDGVVERQGYGYTR